MKEKNLLPKISQRMFAFFIASILCLMSCVAPEITAYADENSPIENPKYTLTTTDGSTVATTANPNETTVLIFGYIGCSKTRSTLSSVASSNWVKRSDIRVIFAETYGHSQQEVSAYKDGYDCEDMIFCYDESDIIFKVMAAYGSLFGLNGGSYPTIVLIDKNNKIQNLLSGTTTADQILSEIKKFEDIDENETGTPPTGSDSGIENIAYGLTTIDGTTVSTKANPNETTVLIFGYTTCGNTKATLRYIDNSSWAGRSDIRIIFADVYGATQAEVTEFAQDYTSGNIIFCYDESTLIYNLSFTYLNLYQLTGGTYPWIVLIDQNNKIQNLTLGPKTADELIAEIEKFTKEEPSTEGTEGNSEQNNTDNSEQNASGNSEQSNTGNSEQSNTGNSEHNTDGTTTDTPTPGVSNVTGLKAVSAAKNIKLTWKKVSDATGYIVYQYNTSTKAWAKKATLNTNTASYTIKGLTSATGYRFAVKAFVTTADGKQITSNSYASLYAATTPSAVTFKVTPGKKKVTLTWKKVKGATGYTVYYKTKANGAWKKLKNTKNLSYTKKKLKSGATYYFTVKAYKTYQKVTYTSSSTSKKVVVK